MSNASFARGWGNRSHGHQREPFPGGMAPLPGRAPRPRGQPVAEVLTSFCCREGLPVGLARGIAGWFAEDGFASFQTLRRPPYLCPEICERVCAYVCARLELSGIFHAGHAFPCLQPFPTSPQACRQTCPRWNPRWNRPPRRSLLSRRGAARALQQKPPHSVKFLSSLISRVLCVCVCARPCTLCFLSLFFFSPLQPALPDG